MTGRRTIPARRMARGAHSGRRGFSLIELMVALAVLSIGGLALISAMRESTRAAVIVQDRALATLAAENLMNTRLAELAAPSDASGRYEMAGAAWEWALEVDETGQAGLVRLTLTLAEENRPDAVAAEIITFRRVRG